MATLALLSAIGLTSARAQTPPPAAGAQNPSPMVEHTRRHERLTPRTLDGTVRTVSLADDRPVEVFVPSAARGRETIDLVIHFHGTAWLPEQAVAAASPGAVTAVVNLGAGSGGYHRAFADPAAFDSLAARVLREVSSVTGRSVRMGRLTLVGFSAGHGAIRAVLAHPRHAARVDAVMLLDGMHTSYVPEGVPLANGGVLDTTNLVALAAFAAAATRGEKQMLITHSEIFPGTFASTTETADWLVARLGRERTPVLAWAPRGMQQLSELHAGRLTVLGYAGNSAPDHVDQLHAMPELLALLLGS